MKIAIQGIEGSFHYQAARELFTGYEYKLLNCENFRDVFDTVENESADYGIVAIENSLHGSINQVYRLLAEKKLNVCGEIRLQIKLYLIGAENYGLRMVNIPDTEVYSQREALNQCEQWFEKNLNNVKLIEYSDTAEAVKYIMKENNSFKLAVGSSEAATKYHGSIIKGPINDDLDNYTRFFLVSKEQFTPPDADRTSIILKESKADKAGTLYDAIGVFAKLNINLSKLDSHPLPGLNRKYLFFIDFDKSIQNLDVKNALNELEKQGWDIRILGSYKAFKH